MIEDLTFWNDGKQSEMFAAFGSVGVAMAFVLIVIVHAYRGSIISPNEVHMSWQTVQSLALLFVATATCVVTVYVCKASRAAVVVAAEQAKS